MTEHEYSEKLDNILSELPIEFRSMVNYYCWDKGHAYGYEEVLSYAEALTSELKEPIANFRARVVAEATKTSHSSTEIKL